MPASSHPLPTLRLAGEGEDWGALTALLHRAYGTLAAQGLRFYASHQPAEQTQGQARWYDRPEVAKFGQMAVEPSLRRRGLGGQLMDLVEHRARELGALELALDTAEGASDLLRMYEARGYRFIEEVDWRPTTNYRSRLLSLRL